MASLAVLAVELKQESFDQLAGRCVVALVGDPAALAADPAPPDVEDVDGHLERVLGECDDVGVGRVAEDDGVLLHRPLQRRDVVPQPGRTLVVGRRRGGAHLPLEAPDVGGRLPLEEGDQVVDDGAMFLGADPAHAWRGALADVAEQARPPDLPCPLEHTLRAAAHREDPQELVEGLADRPGVRIGPEVPHAALLRPPHHQGARILLVQRHGEVRIGLVVAVADVEAGVELLDPRVFELQRLDLGPDDRPLDLARSRHHGQRAGMQRGEILEVRRQPGAQALGLADVDDPAGRVAEPVDTGFVRHRPRRGAIHGRVRHSHQA